MRLSALALPALLASFLFPRLSAAQSLPPGRTGTGPDTTVASDSALTFRANASIQGKLEKEQNLRCVPSELFNPLAGCQGSYIPSPGVDLDLESRGRVGQRFFVDINYNSKREFDASSVFSVGYKGLPGEWLQSVDLGNVVFAPPPSRFITANIPAGNYGIQATGQVGPFRMHAIAAQQKGNIVRSDAFQVGDHTVQSSSSQLEDYQLERLRFFFTVDPARFAGQYPNIDILDRGQLNLLRAELPDSVRPTQVLLYRFQFGTAPQNPTGPLFRLNGDDGLGSTAPVTYDLLREGVDYVMDPSLLWFALVRPLNATNERLVVAYYVTINGQQQVIAASGGTPDIQATPGDRRANLVWDPNIAVTPTSQAFRREIRSVYRLGGEDMVRSSARVRIVTGAGDQERPLAGAASTFAQMLGIAQANNDGEFDAENRLWPRPADGVFNLSAGAGAGVGVGDATRGIGTTIIRDQYLVFPSLRPFAARDSGLIDVGNPANPEIYSTPTSYLDSPQHPSSVYRIKIQSQSTGSPDPGTIQLGAVQVRPGSERVTVDDQPLVRERDYRVDYDLGRITILRPDTLFQQQRTVRVQYEENPVAAGFPTSLAGLVTELPLRNGGLTFTAIRQSQSTAFTRPQLGAEASATVMAGMTGNYVWSPDRLTRWLNALPFVSSTAASRIAVHGEIATSRPQIGGAQAQPYVASFEDAEGFPISLTDVGWYFSSLPAYGNTLPARFGPGFFEAPRAAPLAWQTNATGPTNHAPIILSIKDIDPLTALTGTGFSTAETLLWLTLHPLSAGGLYDAASGSYHWTVDNAVPGQRFRSIRTVLSPAGVDLSRDEFIELWTLVDMSAAGRTHNPTLVFDFGDVSENSLVFGPQTLTINPLANGTPDSVYTGKQLQGFDQLDTERDPFSRAFNVATNDIGLPGDRVDRLTVINGASVITATNVPICRGAGRALRPLGDTRADCTVGNAHLDEEDIDLDNALNFSSAQRESERILRYIVDLSDPARYSRTGGDYTDSVLVGGVRTARTRKWVLVRIPFRTPDDSLGAVDSRRIRALRITMVSGVGAADDELTQIPIARLQVTGAPWTRRSDRPLSGAGGEQVEGGFVSVTTIGTTDSSSALVYQPPPGVRNEAATQATEFEPGQTANKEQSLPVLAGDLPLYGRAEAY